MITDFNLFEYSPLPTIVSDSNGNIIFRNKNTNALFQEINIPEDSNTISILFPTFNLQKPKKNQILNDKNGHPIAIDIETVNYKDQNEFYLLFLQKTNQNIFIDKKQYLIQQKYKVYEDFIDTIKQGVLVFDVNGKLQFTNKKAKNLLGLVYTNRKKIEVWDLFDYFINIDSWKEKISLLSLHKIIKFNFNKKNKFYQAEIQKKIYENRSFYLLIYTDITKKVSDTKIIKEQHNEIDFLHKNFPAAFFQLNVTPDKETYFEYVSESFQEIFGFELRTYQSKWDTKLVLHPEDFDSFIEAKNRAIANVQEFKYTGRFELSSGEIIWFDTNAIPIINENEITFNGIIQNITERKKEEAEISKKRFFNDSILYNIPADIAYFDKDHNYLFINPQAISDDTTRNWLIGRNDFDYCEMRGIDTSIAKKRRAYFNQAKETKKQVDWIDEITINGKSKSVLRRFYPIFMQGEFTNMIGYGVDVSELKSLQKTLDHTQYQKELILKSALDGVVMIDNNWTVTYWNPEAENIFGWKSCEVMGHNLSLIIFPKIENVNYDIRDYFKKNSDQLETKKTFEFNAITKENKEITVELIIVFLVNEGFNSNFVVFIRNVTSQKEKEKQIRFQNELLIKQNRELEQFNFITSHDLQEPLLSLIGYSNLLKEDYADKLDDEGKLFIEFISNSATRMRALISGLLEYNRIVKNKETLTCDLNDIIVEVLDDLHAGILETRALIIYSKLPTINCYPVFFRLLLQNLISNAIKFKKKAIKPKIVLSVKETRQKWIFSVKDNGIGIDEKHFEQIFIMFKRLNNINDYKGYGIGLSYCKRIVEIHNGEIWVNSRPNKGCTFYFTIDKNI
jgi:PAS domain S-box-containing protein